MIEYTNKTKQFRDYTDPDGNMEIDLMPDDGLVHDITTATSTQMVFYGYRHTLA